ncbi:TPA: exo-alpha-sialidase [Bacillus paranthracis]|uniref:exo-alpha-sialidase n=1 Tax=Bacillus TaxID=1386 RepID=UPI0010FF7F7B|nr:MULTISPECIES: exo-alpha-sialidase [Bacillus]MCW4576323.1 exo-alpha-sialidase [Bacillus pacificus]MDA1584586.1 exo-alpha-sialidase [Bacillus cereus group sp. TH230-1LC]MBG9908757.1 hypothetical protein [Bacillus paranthracis]MED0975964.1 exo-alpha-sialidase [Bacillus paranthracis]MED1134666.1 exo-alpha-sialidase [Bacillus paranthracis]
MPPKPNDKGVQVNNPASDVDNFPRITQSETSLARFKDFILYGFNDSNNLTGFSGFAFSSDLGKHWTDGGSIPTIPGQSNGGDPTITVDKKGIFYYGQIHDGQTGITVSTGIINPNKTITMNQPQFVGTVDADGLLTDKPWITVGSDKNNPGKEALYVVWIDLIGDPARLGQRIKFSKWNTGVTVTPIIQNETIPAGTNEFFGAFPVVDPHGNIYVFYEDFLPNSFTVPRTPNRSIRMVKSTDGGVSFQAPVQVSNGLFAAAGNANSTACGSRNVISVTPERVIRMFEIPQATIGPDGTIYVVWNAGIVINNKVFINVFLAHSKDEGKTWTQVNVTQDHSSFAFFPSVAANSKGAHIQYNRFNDPKGDGEIGDGTFGVFMKSFSVSKGLSQESVVSNPSSPVPITAPSPDAVRNCYMGDYNQVITGPGDSLLHAWSDNRNTLNGRNNPDVFFRKTDSKKKP